MRGHADECGAFFLGGRQPSLCLWLGKFHLNVHIYHDARILLRNPLQNHIICGFVTFHGPHLSNTRISKACKVMTLMFTEVRGVGIVRKNTRMFRLVELSSSFHHSARKWSQSMPATFSSAGEGYTLKSPPSLATPANLHRVYCRKLLLETCKFCDGKKEQFPLAVTNTAVQKLLDHSRS